MGSDIHQLFKLAVSCGQMFLAAPEASIDTTNRIIFPDHQRGSHQHCQDQHVHYYPSDRPERFGFAIPLIQQVGIKTRLNQPLEQLVKTLQMWITRAEKIPSL